MRVDFADELDTGFAGDLVKELGRNGAYDLDNSVQPRWCTRVTTRQNPQEANLLALTDGQRDCLRLVYNHMKSKDIARILGVSPHTVDQRLRIAMRTLGVTSRIEAARLLVQEESGGETTPDMYQPLIYQAPDIAGAINPATMQSPALDGSGETGSPIYSDASFAKSFSPGIDPLVNGPPRLADASMTAEAMSLAASPRSIAVDAGSFDPGAGIHPTEPGKGLSKPWGARNDLAVGARLTWIFLIAVGSALAFGAILSALAALKTLI